MTHGDFCQEVVDRLRQARKYRHLCEDTLYRVADWAGRRHPNGKTAVRAAKRKLHQVYGAYLDAFRFARVEELLGGLSPSLPDADLRAACYEILQCHASTAERLPIMAGFYRDLFEEIGQPRTLLDLACGLHPFALPWMGLDRAVRYVAYDIDHRLVGAANDFFRCVGHGPGAVCRDILVSGPDLEADVVFLFKSVPCLEQQMKGATGDLLRRLRADYVVVSFPVRTLGGREKGMAQHYDALMDRMVDDLKVPVRKMAYPVETFYVLGG